MTILCDSDINKLRLEGPLRIEPFDEKRLTPNGYDLTVSEVKLGGDVSTNGSPEIPRMRWFMVSTGERVSLDSSICASLWLRSSWSRKGILGSFGKVDAGFDGHLILSLFNASDGSIKVPIGETLVQIVFEKLDNPSRLGYPARTGTYQGQRGF